MTRPLLSRSQLSLLILLLPGVILLLSRLGPTPEAESNDWQTSQDRRIYQQQIPTQAHYQLHLLLPQTPVASAEQQLEQQLLLAALQQRIGSTDMQQQWLGRLGTAPHMQIRPGYLLLQLELDHAPASSDLAWLLHQLQQPPVLDWSALLQRVQAEQYLARQTPEAWLRSQFPANDTGSRTLNPLAAYRQWLDPGHWRLALTAPEIVPLELAETADTAADRPVQPLPVSALPVSTPASRLPLQLHRWPLPALDSVEHFALTLLARAAVQQQLSAELTRRQSDTQAGFSLNWTPALPQGRAVLILQGEGWPTLDTWLPQQMARIDLARARETVMQQVRLPEQQQAWADLLAAYQLPADTLLRLPEALAAIQPSDLHHWLQQQLESDYYHTLSLPASP